MNHDHSHENTDLVKRLKSARGHLDKVIDMVDKGEYCIDILQQSLAVQSALKRTDEAILTNHLQTCVRKAVSDEEKDKQINEIIDVFKKGRK
jgi:DNA-binding FrmR family transcriptional regulator